MNRIRNLLLLAVTGGLLLSMVFDSVSLNAAVDRGSQTELKGDFSGADVKSAGEVSESPMSGNGNSAAAWILWPLGLAEVWIVGWLCVWSAALIAAPGVICRSDVFLRKFQLGRLPFSENRQLSLADLSFVSTFARHHRVLDVWVSERMREVSDWLSTDEPEANAGDRELLVNVDGLMVALDDAATVRAMLPETPFLLAIDGEGRGFREQTLSVLLRQATHEEDSARLLAHQTVPVILDRKCVERLRSSETQSTTSPLWMRVLRNELCRIPGIRSNLDDRILQCLVENRRILPIADEWARLPAMFRYELQSAVSTGELPALVVIDDRGVVAEMEGVIHARSAQSTHVPSLPDRTAAASSKATTLEPIHPVSTDPSITGRRFDAGSVPMLIRSLDDPSAGIRKSAAVALGKLGVGGSTASEELIALLRDPVTSCRQAAADALGAIGRTEAAVVQALSEAAVKDHRMVRAAACRALGAISRADQVAFDALADALGDGDPNVRSEAARSLGSVFSMTPETMQVLRSALSDDVPSVRCQVVAALSRIPDASDEALSDLVAAVADPVAEVRREVVTVLGNASRARQLVAQALTQALSDPDSETRSRAALSLSNLGSDARSAVPELARLANDSDSNVRRSAVTALDAIGLQNLITVSAIEEATRDTDEAVRSTAQRALNRGIPSKAA